MWRLKRGEKKRPLSGAALSFPDWRRSVWFSEQPLSLPLLDELRTFCYEHKIEEIPALLAV
jgi:hypothetical protein